MPSYATLDHLKPFFGVFVSNDVGDTTLADSVLQKQLSDDSLEIESEWDYGDDTIPVTPSDPLTWLDYLLILLNRDPVLHSVFLDRAKAKYELFKRQAALYEKLSLRRRKAFKVGRLSASILAYLDNKVIETDPFIEEADVQELAVLANGLVINSSSTPNTAQAMEIATIESAWIRAFLIAAYGNKPGGGLEHLLIENLTDKQLDKLKTLTINLSAPHIARIDAQHYSPTGDEILLTKLEQALDDVDGLVLGRYNKIFLVG